MTERGIQTEMWDSDEWFQDLNRDQRYLFLYLWTNNHCKQAGIYHITLSTIAFEAKFSKEELPKLLVSLAPKVKWFREESLIWVKNFIKHQLKSPKFLIAAAKCLTLLANSKIAGEVVEYNAKMHSISIPYQYSTDTVSILPLPLTPIPLSLSTVSNPSKGESEGEVPLLPIFVKNYRLAFGKTPNSKFTAQLRDLSIELVDFAVSEKQIKEAFREAAGQESTKWTVSYVRAILLAWLGAGKGPP